MEPNMIILFSLFYIFFSALLIAPPTEFISAGLTVQNILSSLLGIYYICLGLFAPELQLFTPWDTSPIWQLYLALCLTIVAIVSLIVLYWSWRKWDYHPIAKQLGHLSDSTSTWRAVAASINMEFRRIEKFSSGKVTGTRVIVTDSWVMKTSTYFVNVAHQNDIHLTLTESEDHSISYEMMTSVQFLKFTVAGINPKIRPFTLRLNSLEYGELKDKLQAPVRTARNIVVRQTLSEQFLQAFAEQISQNPTFHMPDGMEADTCIGCMMKESDIKLQKHCDVIEAGECAQCYCRPMWCLECMGKWFASRQNQQQPETWLGSRSPCPTCRAVFCMLDVCLIVK